MLPLRDNIPTTRTAYVTYGLIVANVLVYFFWQRGGLTLGRPELAALHLPAAGLRRRSRRRSRTRAASRCMIATGCPNPPTANPYLTIFTAMFMHGGLLHLGGNMLFLWIFGNNVEDAMGPVKFLLFYLLGGVAALALQVVDRPELDGADARRLGGDRRRAGRLHPAVPARAGGDGDLHRLLLHDPRAAGAARARASGSSQQALFGYFDLAQPSGGGGGVAYFAHIGGFVFGLLAVRALRE